MFFDHAQRLREDNQLLREANEKLKSENETLKTELALYRGDSGQCDSTTSNEEVKNTSQYMMIASEYKTCGL